MSIMHEKIFTLKVKICIHGTGVNGTSAMAERRIYVMREVVMNKKTNLLQLEEHFYQLADVKEPNVFHNLFPYDEIPKIAFNDRICHGTCAIDTCAMNAYFYF